MENTISKQVYSTKNYSMFKSIDGNWDINQIHLQRLSNSIRDNYLFTSIVVNEKYEIIDGQHRFDVIKRLGLELNYIICNGYGLKEVQILNQNSRSWQMNDFLDAYVKLGYPDYIKYKEFFDKYNLSHTLIFSLLKNKSHMLSAEAKKQFGKGLFRINDYNKAVLYAENIMALRKYLHQYKDRNFVFALMKLFDSNVFDFNELLSKLELQPNAFKPCKTIIQYIEMIEDVYNYKRREKISFKYLK
jgi:hypothetical protein